MCVCLCVFVFDQIFWNLSGSFPPSRYFKAVNQNQHNSHETSLTDLIWTTLCLSLQSFILHRELFTFLTSTFANHVCWFVYNQEIENVHILQFVNPIWIGAVCVHQKDFWTVLYFFCPVNKRLQRCWEQQAWLKSNERVKDFLSECLTYLITMSGGEDRLWLNPAHGSIKSLNLHKSLLPTHNITDSLCFIHRGLRSRNPTARTPEWICHW